MSYMILSDFMKNIIKDLYILLKHGKVNIISHRDSITFTEFTSIIIICIIIQIVSSLFVSICFFLLQIETNEYVLNQNIHLLSFFQGLIMVCIIGPIIEEFGFRLCLKYSRFNFSIMCGYFYYMIFWIIFRQTAVIWERDFFLLSVVSTLFVVFIINFFLNWKENLNIELTKFWTNHPRYIFYSSVYVFGFIHIANYKISLNILILSPILLLPQTLSGVTFSYTRLKYGILYSILLHSVFNLCPYIKYLFK